MKYTTLLSTTANLANGSSGMSDDLKGAIITALVTGIISIIGFIVTNASMKKNFKNELKRQRDSVALEKMSTMPYHVEVRRFNETWTSEVEREALRWAEEELEYI